MARTTMSFMMLMISGSLFAAVGAPCRSQAGCAKSEQCILEFNQGYCASFGCSEKNACAPDAKCMSVEGENFNVCLKQCIKNSDCRSGYSCHSGGVCLALDA